MTTKSILSVIPVILDIAIFCFAAWCLHHTRVFDKYFFFFFFITLAYFMAMTGDVFRFIPANAGDLEAFASLERQLLIKGGVATAFFWLVWRFVMEERKGK